MEIMKLQTRLSFHFVNRKDNPRTNLLMEVKSNQIKGGDSLRIIDSCPKVVLYLYK